MKLRLAILVAAVLGAFLMALAQSAPKPLSSFDPQVAPLLSRMTLDEKIGQMTQPEQDALKDPADHREPVPRLGAERRRFRPQGRQQPQGLDRSLRPHPAAHPEDAPRASRSSTASTRCTATTTCSAPSSSRTTSAWAARAIPRWWRRWSASPPKRSAPPASSGPSLPASRCRRTSAGAEPTKASRKTRKWCAELAGRGGPRLPGRRPGQPARRAGLRQALSSAMAARRSVPRRAAGGSTRAIPASTRPRCAAFTCRATSRPSRPASAPSCPPTAVGTA